LAAVSRKEIEERNDNDEIAEEDLEVDVDYIILDNISRNDRVRGAPRREKIGISKRGALLLNANLSTDAREYLRLRLRLVSPSLDDSSDAESVEAEFIESPPDGDDNDGSSSSSRFCRETVLSFAFRKWRMKEVLVSHGKDGLWNASRIGINADGTAAVRWHSRAVPENVDFDKIQLSAGVRGDAFSLYDELLELEKKSDDELDAIEAIYDDEERKREGYEEAAASRENEIEQNNHKEEEESDNFLSDIGSDNEDDGAGDAESTAVENDDDDDDDFENIYDGNDDDGGAGEFANIAYCFLSSRHAARTQLAHSSYSSSLVLFSFLLCNHH
jgi:hypothetical protein